MQHNFQSKARVLDGTIEALPKMIDDLQKQGYKFVTLQTLLDKEYQEEERKKLQNEEPTIEEPPAQPEPIVDQPIQESPLE